MSQQPITKFFKTTSQGSGGHLKKDMDRNKRRNLGLLRNTTPKECVKTNHATEEVIELLSDDESFCTPDTFSSCTPGFKIETENLNVDKDKAKSPTKSVHSNSFSTIIYSFTETSPTLQEHHKIPSTDKKRKKFFSPVKKRGVHKRTPVKAKCNLMTEFNNYSLNLEDVPKQSLIKAKCNSMLEFYDNTKNIEVKVNKEMRFKNNHNIMPELQNNILNEDQLFKIACEGMDDKTIFLLTTISKYLKDTSIRHLLDENAQELLSKCLHVTKPGMRLVCRLYWRRPGWYRWESIAQISREGKELDDPSFMEMMGSLSASGLIAVASLEGDTAMSFEDYTTVLKAEELKLICKELKLKMQSKQKAIEALRSFSNRTSNISSYFKSNATSSNSSRVLKIMCAKSGPCYKLSEFARDTLYKLYVLMYLGMNYQIIREKKLELMLLHDKTKFETYPVDKGMELDNASVVFETREQFERYLKAHYIYEDFLAKSDVADKCNLVIQAYDFYKAINEEEMSQYKALQLWLLRFTPANLYVKIMEVGIQELKKDKNGTHYQMALDILSMLISQTTFRQHKKAHWYAEKALILHNLLHKHNEAAEVLLEGFTSNMSGEAKDILRPRANKIANQKNIKLSDHLKCALLEHSKNDDILEKNLSAEHIYKQPMEQGSQHRKVRFETRSEGGRTIQDAEDYCASQYIHSGEYTRAEHWEGRIVTSIFFLLFWDIVYSKPRGVQGVFLSYYQMYPLDMFCESFYINRKSRIEDRLAEIEKSSMDQILQTMNNVILNRPIGELSGIYSNISWQDISEVCKCLGPVRLAAICRRLARDYRYTHSGFPDLTVWNVHTGQIKFVEVKTDTDKPSMKQIQWMHYLRQHGIGTEFCYVGVNTTRTKSRPPVRKK